MKTTFACHSSLWSVKQCPELLLETLLYLFENDMWWESKCKFHSWKQILNILSVFYWLSTFKQFPTLAQAPGIDWRNSTSIFTNNARRKTLIGKEQFCVQAVFWIRVLSEIQGGEIKKWKKEREIKSFDISPTQKIHTLNLSNQISFPLLLSGSCYQFILQHFLSILYCPLSNKRNL